MLAAGIGENEKATRAQRKGTQGGVKMCKLACKSLISCKVIKDGKIHRRGEVILLVVLCLKGSEASERKTREEGHQTTAGSIVQRANRRARVFIFHFLPSIYVRVVPVEAPPRRLAPLETLASLAHGIY